MKLEISKDENGAIGFTFEGTPEDAIQAIATLMTRQPVLRGIIYTSTELYSNHKEKLMENIKSITVEREEINPNPQS